MDLNFFNDLMTYFQPSQEELSALYLEANKRYLCGIINASGFLHMTVETIPTNWEITDQPDPKGMERLAADYIEYRRDKALGNL